jgi:hypothetical protein
MSDLRDQLSQLWNQIVDVEAEINKFTEFQDPAPITNPPATVIEIDALEHHLGLTLPPSYREFLFLFNGMQNLEGDMPLLSTHEIIAGNQGWVEEIEEERPELVRFHIAGNDETNAGYYVFDCDRTSGDGEMETVHLTLNLQEYRWTSFFEMLQDRLRRSSDVLKREIADREMLED